MLILKTDAIPIIELLLGNILSKITTINIPTSDVSDIDKINIKVFYSFFKLIESAIEVDASFLFSERNIPSFLDFLKYLIAHFENNIDKATKKMLTYIFKEMVIEFSGLKLNS